MSSKHRNKGAGLGLEQAKRLLEEKTNAALCSTLANQILGFLQGEIGADPSTEEISTVICALEHTRYTMLRMARLRGYAEPAGQLLDATRIVADAAFSTALALADIGPDPEPDPGSN